MPPLSRHRALAPSAALLAIALAAIPADGMAQQTPNGQAATNGAPASQAPASEATPPSTTNPHLSVATVQLQDGIRAGKIIGSTVQNAQGTDLGSVSDLILNKSNTVVMAVISIGGFAGIGAKLVAVPFSKLQLAGGGKVVLPDGSKESMQAMPSFVY